MAVPLTTNNKHRLICKKRATKPALLAMAIAQALITIPLAAQAAGEVKSEMQVIGRSATAPSTGYSADYSAASTGMSLSLRETPQSVSVITQQRIQDQGLKTLDDIMTNTNGITFHQLDNTGRITYRARGFNISNFKTDGLTTNYNNGGNGHGTTLNMDIYDHVDIIHGANGLLGGTGDPSATVNLVRKRPGKQMSANLGLTYGRWDKKQMFADLNAPLGFDGRVRSRFVISAEDSGSYLERAGNKNLSALANFEVDITSSTLLNIGAQYDRSRIKGASWGSNVPVWYADGTRTNLPRNTNPVPDWANSETGSTTFFGSIEQYFAHDWKTKLAVSHNISTVTYARGASKVNYYMEGKQRKWSGFWNQDGTGAWLNAAYSDYSTKEDNIEWTLNGLFHLFGRTHELMGGINGYHIESTQYTFNQLPNGTLGNCDINGVASARPDRCQYRVNSLSIPDWRTWSGNYPGFNVHRTNERSVDITTNYGGYIAGRFSLADPLSAIVGVRMSNYRTRQDKYNAASQLKHGDTRSNNGVITPYAGILYDISDNHSVYASYTSVFSPQTGKQDEQGKQITPVTGDSYEAGLKSEFFEGRLNTSAILFLVQQQNVARKINGATTPSGADAYSASERGIRSKGLELEVSGALTDNWNIYFGYTWLNVNNPNPNADLEDPRHVVRLFTTYQLPGMLNDLTVGGGVRAQTYTTTTPNPGRPVDLANQKFDKTPLASSGYGLVDLMARYQFNKNVSLSVNINNLFDKTYYRNIGFYDGLIYGEPRSYWATLNIRY